MSFYSIKLDSASKQMHSNLAGKLVSCVFNPMSGGAIPPGNYKISAPMRNTVYGPFALLAALGNLLGMGKDWISKGWIEPRVPGQGVRALWIDIRPGVPVGKATWIDARSGFSGANAGWIDLGIQNSGTSWIENPSSYVDQQGIFVIVGKPLSGRNTIEITAGFSELISALAQAGGSEVIVS
jgi:hypothetical protein